MAFTPTPRRLGEDMVTIRVRFDLDGTALARILGRETFDDATDYGTDLEAQASKAKAEQDVRGFLLAYGNSEMDPLDDHDDADLRFAWGAEQVKRLWPSMTVREY